MTKFLERKQLKYCSHEVQNKFLSILLPACCQQSSTGKANKEQVVLVFWWVDNALVVHEEFVGLYLADYHIKGIIGDCDQGHRCHGQCYNGASPMSGAKKGVAKML